MKVTNQRSDVIVTYSLGSCVGVTLYDPEACVGAMIHCMLPLSKVDHAKAEVRPFMFVDTGVPRLLQAVFDLGAQRKRLICKVAGGASLLDEKKLFRIGERNYTVLRKILWKNDILIDAEDIGGQKARTMYLYMATGQTTIKSKGIETELA
jgi:chemotaxis protein CheD